MCKVFSASTRTLSVRHSGTSGTPMLDRQIPECADHQSSQTDGLPPSSRELPSQEAKGRVAEDTRRQLPASTHKHTCSHIRASTHTNTCTIHTKDNLYVLFLKKMLYAQRAQLVECKKEIMKMRIIGP